MTLQELAARVKAAAISLLHAPLLVDGDGAKTAKRASHEHQAGNNGARRRRRRRGDRGHSAAGNARELGAQATTENGNDGLSQNGGGGSGDPRRGQEPPGEHQDHFRGLSANGAVSEEGQESAEAVTQDSDGQGAQAT